jgi:hypothetical protein
MFKTNKFDSDVLLSPENRHTHDIQLKKALPEKLTVAQPVTKVPNSMQAFHFMHQK